MAENSKTLNKWGLLNSLISIINEGTEEDANVTIAKYLLANYNRLQDLNIYDVAEECFVSRATIRRMAQNLGFENFKDMKRQFANFFDNYIFYRSGIESSSNGFSMAEQLYHMALECERYLTPDKINEIIDLMNRANQIAFLTSDVYSRQSSEFQKAMILAGKIVRVVSNKFYDNSVLKGLHSEDILIVISISGFFANETLSAVQEVKGYKILATTVQDDIFDSAYDMIWYLSDSPKVQGRSVYTIYALQYFLEAIFAAYIKKYGE